MTPVQEEMLVAFEQISQLTVGDPIAFDANAMARTLVEELEVMWPSISSESKSVVLSIVIRLMRQPAGAVHSNLLAQMAGALLRRH